MEKALKIRTEDGHYIYGTLTSPSLKVKKVILIVHGFSGHQDEHPYYNGAKYFVKHGFATCRFDLYTWKTKGRKLDETTIKIHAQDTNKVVEYLRKRGYKKIFVVGHSLSGLSTLLVNTKRIKGIILWDPSSDNLLRKKNKWIKYNKKINNYIFDGGIRFIFGKKMYHEWKNFPDIIHIIKKITKPLLIITAGKGILKKRCKQYYANANQPKKFVLIKRAGHIFSEEGVEEELFKETLEWCKKFSK
ncbi:alpha/beta hydrolase [Candidatus Woesearchaeota archaeon]|nr:alpha/beta hydrolase [Candidatus Woesearchaeota archaeon]